MTAAFYWIGVGVVLSVGGLLALAVIFWLYANLIHRRFGLIFFARRRRRLSIALWYAAKVMPTSAPDRDDDWRADDFPINRRPFLLTYRIGRRSYFLMAGYLAPRRHMQIEGKHPDA